VNGLASIGLLSVGGNTNIGSTLSVVGNTNLLSYLTVVGTGFFGLDVTVSGDLDVNGTITGATGNFETLYVYNDTYVGGQLSVVGFVTVGENLHVLQDVSIGGELSVNQYASFGSGLDVTGNVRIAGSLSVAHSVTIDGELTALGSVSFANDLTVAGNATVGQNLIVLGFANINRSLTIQEDAVFEGDVTINGDLHINGSLTVDDDAIFNNLIADDVHILGDLSVDNATTFGDDVSVAGDLTVDDTLYAHNLNISGNLETSGSVFFNQSVTVGGDASISGTLSVGGDTTVEGRLEIVHGPLSFPYNGTEPTIDAQAFTRLPYPNPEESYPEFVIVFANLTEVEGRWYDLQLTGYTLNFLEPQQRAPHVYFLWTFALENPNGNNVVFKYRYEVGDVILLKGPSDIEKIVTLWDFEDVLAAVGPTRPGNIYNGRSIVTESMSMFAEVLNSDEIVLYMYSPRPKIGPNANGAGQSVLQDSPVEWVKFM